MLLNKQPVGQTPQAQSILGSGMLAWTGTYSLYWIHIIGPSTRKHMWHRSSLSIRMIFTWLPKVICICFGFALLLLVIGLKNTQTLSQPSRSKTKTKISQLVRTHFPALHVSYMYFLHVLIWDCLCSLGLASAITPVYILQRSLENCSIAKHRLDYHSLRFPYFLISRTRRISLTV